MTLQANPEGTCKVCDRAFLRFRTMQAVKTEAERGS